ncbi:hypothetical protein I4U23_012324 [Adineta vaga]|nr:hypothetical protein I4U23_012324 [Adineta vaga]
MSICTCASYQYRDSNDNSEGNQKNTTKWFYKILTNESCLALSSLSEYINVSCCYTDMCNDQGFDDDQHIISFTVSILLIFVALYFVCNYVLVIDIRILFEFTREIFNSAIFT